MQTEWSKYGMSGWSNKGTYTKLLRTQYDSGPYSANSVTFDKSSTFLAVASDEGVVKLFNDTTNKLEHTLKGH
jgi:WD40 repeat protein